MITVIIFLFFSKGGRLSTVPDLLQGMQQRLPLLPPMGVAPTDSGAPPTLPHPLNLLGMRTTGCTTSGNPPAPSPAAADTIMAAAAAAQQNHQRLILNYKAAISKKCQFFNLYLIPPRGN